jgi:transcriptional regulator with XRE-family HTH domain
LALTIPRNIRECVLQSIYALVYLDRVTPIHLRLREFREAAGLTQLELSDRARVRQATISQLESGKRQRVDLSILERLARALKVEPSELLTTRKRVK